MNVVATTLDTPRRSHSFGLRGAFCMGLAVVRLNTSMRRLRQAREITAFLSSLPPPRTAESPMS